PPIAFLGEVAIDIHSHGLRGPSRSVRLTRTEWLLLDEMVQGRGRFLTHEELLSQIWGAGYEGQHRLLHDTVSRLRHRLREAGGSADCIETIHGVGYRLASES